MLQSSLWDYSDAYALVKGTKSIAPQAGANSSNDNEEVVFKNCAPFTDCISEINNRQIGNSKDKDVVMPMYNLIEYSNNYSKTSGRLQQYYRDEPFLDDNNAIANFPAPNNNSASFKFKQKITREIGAGRTKQVEIIKSLKYLSFFWRTLEMSLINCEIKLILTWSDQWVLSNDAKAITFAITDINWYNLIHQSKVKIQAPNPYSDYLIDPSFQEVNRRFDLLFENTTDRTVHTKYYLSTVEIKDYNAMIDGQNFFNQPVKSN